MTAEEDLKNLKQELIDLPLKTIEEVKESQDRSTTTTDETKHLPEQS